MDTSEESQSLKVSVGLPFPQITAPIPLLNLQLIPLIHNLVSPVCLRDFNHSLYVADQIGLIYKINPTTRESTLFLDIRDRLVTLRPDYDERGLLAFAFQPDRLFVYYSAKIPGIVDHVPYYNRLSEFQTQSDQVDLSSEIVLLQFFKDQTYHNGADLHFGPDGYLYITVGDGGPQQDPRNHAQDLSVPYGKILRINVSFPGTYTIPPDNPFIDVPGVLPEIYALGFRNPWRASFDSAGRLFVGDVGDKQREEIDIVVKGGNYGWNAWEGTWRTPWSCPENYERIMIQPIYEYQYRPGTSAVIGGYFINDEVGYIFGDYHGLIMRIVENKITGQWQLAQAWNIYGFVKSFGQDHDGNIYVLVSDKGPVNRNGSIHILRWMP